ncbi:heat-shock protein Hsp15 [Arthrobacter sp. NtRootA9]|nr:heat-shock protein Hsp15 [Arthrobacter sp. NtRootA9]
MGPALYSVPAMTSLPAAPATARVDAWLWAIRAYKTRSAATAACRAGHVRLNGTPAKASATLATGDTVTVRMPGYERILEVRRLIVKRVSAEAASHCFTDHTPPRPLAPALGIPQRDRGAGRPTKKDRREMDRLRGSA